MVCAICKACIHDGSPFDRLLAQIAEITEPMQVECLVDAPIGLQHAGKSLLLHGESATQLVQIPLAFAQSVQKNLLFGSD